MIPAETVNRFEAMPKWLADGMQIWWWRCTVGYAMVINMMASREVWPFAIGFALAAVSHSTLDRLS